MSLLGVVASALAKRTVSRRRLAGSVMVRGSVASFIYLPHVCRKGRMTPFFFLQAILTIIH